MIQFADDGKVLRCEGGWEPGDELHGAGGAESAGCLWGLREREVCHGGGRDL